MKKILLLALCLVAYLGAFAGSQGEDNGLDIKLHVGFHGDKFAFSDVDLSNYGFLQNEYPFKNATPTFGLAMSSRWYLAEPGSVGIAVNARWFDFAFANCVSKMDMSYNVPSSVAGKPMSLDYTATTKTQFFDFSVAGVGPLATYYFNSKMSVDLYYNVMPNVFLISAKNPELASSDPLFALFYDKLMTGDSDDRHNTFAFGASHRIGAAYRYKVFEAGVEMKFGKMKFKDWGNDRNEEMSYIDEMYRKLSADKIRTNAFRVFIGFKF